VRYSAVGVGVNSTILARIPSSSLDHSFFRGGPFQKAVERSFEMTAILKGRAGRKSQEMQPSRKPVSLPMREPGGVESRVMGPYMVIMEGVSSSVGHDHGGVFFAAFPDD